MLIQMLLALGIGLIAGTITGLIPGIHINLISAGIISLAVSFLAKVNPIYLVIFVVAMSITHTFMDFIPSVLLGCPDTDTELSVLPGHELLKQGHGYQAIMLTLYGSIAAVFILIVIAVPFGILIKQIYETITQFMPYILSFVLIILVSMEKKKINSIIVISLTGILGYLVLNYPGLNQPFLPLLSGLFGASNLILSIKNKTKIPTQKIENPKAKLFRPLLGSVIASPICAILPGLGAGQASILGYVLTNKKRHEDKKGFLILLGATNTLVMGFSFVALYLLSKTRTGSAIAVQELIQTLDLKTTILIMVVIFITGIIAFFHTKNLARFFSIKVQNINYTKISIATLIIITVITILISGFLGLIVLIISTITGIYCISLGVRRTNMMGSLLIPTIIYYLF